MDKRNLTIRDHSRDAAGLTYVYPVISRRAGGLSIGINLNTNNACNWHCIYCQVPNLKRGTAPRINLEQLHDELLAFLVDVQNGTFYQQADVPPEARRIMDVAISGNGEATSAAEFDRAVELIGQTKVEAGVDRNVKTVLITNGSLMQRQSVRTGLAHLKRFNGEVWFKIDAGSREQLQQLNGASMSPVRMLSNLRVSTALCPTWIQTCAFALDSRLALDRDAYLNFIRRVVDEQLPVAGVLLYGLARQSMQAGAERLSAVTEEWLEELADDIRTLGMMVRVTQ